MMKEKQIKTVTGNIFLEIRECFLWPVKDSKDEKKFSEHRFFRLAFPMNLNA